jgi:flavorubredoxin
MCSWSRFYYDCLMKPNSKSVITALRKVKVRVYTLWNKLGLHASL